MRSHFDLNLGAGRVSTDSVSPALTKETMYKQTAAELRAWAEAHKALVKVQQLVARRKKRNKLKKETQ